MIHEISPSKGYEGVNCVDSDDHDILWSLNGTSRQDDWRPARMERHAANRGRDRKAADFPWYASDVIVMRRRAVDALADILEAGGEILPLSTDDGVELYALNVTRVLDALDEERSIISRLDSGKIFHIDAPAFHEALVRDVDFFKLPGFRAGEIFVGRRFVERVQAARLVGLDFPLVWSPEGGPVKRRLW